MPRAIEQQLAEDAQEIDAGGAVLINFFRHDFLLSARYSAHGFQKSEREKD